MWSYEPPLRDSRVAMIYEGTNEIQAIDLLVRKVLPDGGAKLERLLGLLEVELPADSELTVRVRALIVQVRRVTAALVSGTVHDAELPHRAAGDYRRLIGLLLLAQGWARADAAAAVVTGEGAFYAAKRDTARYYFNFVLPEAAMRAALIDAAHAALPVLATS